MPEKKQNLSLTRRKFSSSGPNEMLPKLISRTPQPGLPTLQHYNWLMPHHYLPDQCCTWWQRLSQLPQTPLGQSRVCVHRACRRQEGWSLWCSHTERKGNEHSARYVEFRNDGAPVLSWGRLLAKLPFSWRNAKNIKRNMSHIRKQFTHLRDFMNHGGKTTTKNLLVCQEIWADKKRKQTTNTCFSLVTMFQERIRFVFQVHIENWLHWQPRMCVCVCVCVCACVRVCAFVCVTVVSLTFSCISTQWLIPKQRWWWSEEELQVQYQPKLQKNLQKYHFTQQISACAV